MKRQEIFKLNFKDIKMDKNLDLKLKKISLRDH